MIVNNQDAWKPVASAANVSINKAQGDQNILHGNRNTLQRDGNMRLEFEGGNLQLRKTTKLVNFVLFLHIIFGVLLTLLLITTGTSYVVRCTFAWWQGLQENLRDPGKSSLGAL
jgi:hypothetical protein